MRVWFVLGILTLLVMPFSAQVAESMEITSGTAHVLTAATFTPSNCARISGWDWVRSSNASVTYVFKANELAGCNINQVYILLSGLCTNGVNGGAGYAATLKLEVTGGDMRGTSTFDAVNPFRPNVVSNSGGLGYAVYGHGGAFSTPLVSQAIAANRLTVKLTFSPWIMTAGRHVALKQDSIMLGFVR